MQGVDVHIQQVVVAIDQSHGLLHLSVHFYFLQSRIHAHAVIDVGHVVAGTQLHQGLQRNGIGLGIP